MLFVLERGPCGLDPVSHVQYRLQVVIDLGAHAMGPLLAVVGLGSLGLPLFALRRISQPNPSLAFHMPFKAACSPPARHAKALSANMAAEAIQPMEPFQHRFFHLLCHPSITALP